MLGKIPNIVIVTVAGASFTSNKLLSFGIYGMYMLVLMAVIYKKFPGLLKTTKNEARTAPYSGGTAPLILNRPLPYFSFCKMTEPLHCQAKLSGDIPKHRSL